MISPPAPFLGSPLQQNVYPPLSCRFYVSWNSKSKSPEKKLRANELTDKGEFLSLIPIVYPTRNCSLDLPLLQRVLTFLSPKWDNFAKMGISGNIEHDILTTWRIAMSLLSLILICLSTPNGCRCGEGRGGSGGQKTCLALWAHWGTQNAFTASGRIFRNIGLFIHFSKTLNSISDKLRKFK